MSVSQERAIEMSDGGETESAGKLTIPIAYLRYHYWITGFGRVERHDYDNATSDARRPPRRDTTRDQVSPHDSRKKDASHDGRRDDLPRDVRRDDLPHDRRRRDLSLEKRRGGLPRDARREDLPRDEQRDEFSQDGRRGNDGRRDDLLPRDGRYGAYPRLVEFFTQMNKLG